jgi:hypothetical protein
MVGAKDEVVVVEALSLLVAAASNRTQEDWAWNTAGYSRSTSKFNSTLNPSTMQARLSRIASGNQKQHWATHSEQKPPGDRRLFDSL